MVKTATEVLRSVPDYLSHDITESIINTIAQLAHLRIVARSSVFRYQRAQIHAHHIAQELNVQAVLLERWSHTGGKVAIVDSFAKNPRSMIPLDSDDLWHTT